MGDALPRLYGPLNPEPEAGRGDFVVVGAIRSGGYEIQT